MAAVAPVVTSRDGLLRLGFSSTGRTCSCTNAAAPTSALSRWPRGRVNRARGVCDAGARRGCASRAARRARLVVLVDEVLACLYVDGACLVLEQPAWPRRPWCRLNNRIGPRLERFTIELRGFILPRSVRKSCWTHTHTFSSQGVSGKLRWDMSRVRIGCLY